MCDICDGMWCSNISDVYFLIGCVFFYLCTWVCVVCMCVCGLLICVFICILYVVFV